MRAGAVGGCRGPLRSRGPATGGSASHRASPAGPVAPTTAPTAAVRMRHRHRPRDTVPVHHARPDRHGDNREQTRPAGSTGPGQLRRRQSRADPRHRGDPPRGPPGELRQHRTARCPPGSDERGKHPGHGGRHEGRGREQVRRDRVGGQGRIQEHDDGRTGGLSGERDGDGVREARGQGAPEPLRDRHGEQHDPCRREHREREPEAAGQPRVRDQQRDHGRAERGDRPGRAPQQQPTDADRTHRGRPEHAGLGVDQQDQGDHRHGDDADAGATRQADQARQAEHRRPDDREVSSRDGGHVRQPGHPHRLGEVRREPGRVADRDARDEPPGVRGEAVCRDQQGGPDPSDGAVDRTRAVHQERRPARRQQRDGLAPPGGCQPPGGLDPRSVGRPGPRGPCEHEDRRGGGPRSAATADLLDGELEPIALRTVAPARG